MSLIRVPFLISTAVGAWLSLTPPNPPPSPDELVKKTGMEKAFGNFVRIHALAWKTSVLMSIFIDLGLVLGDYDVSVYGRRLAPASDWSRGFAPSFLFACSMLWLSGWLRLWCYRTLGRMFTYEVTLRDGHVLVTWGPYAYVRHPSYTGVVFGVLGTLLLHFGPGSWFYDGGWLETRGGLAYAGFWVGMEAYVLMCIMTRVPKEDGLLKSQFKDEWSAWAAKVPYRVVPGIY